jgi:hypothetical protein
VGSNIANVCTEKTCSNGGKCTKKSELLRCECTSLYTGTYCDVPNDPRIIAQLISKDDNLFFR